MNTIAEYSTTQAALAELQARWAVVPDTNTKIGYDLVKSGIKELSGYRSKLEGMRKELKAPHIERGKLLDSEAKRITAELVAIETPLKEAKQATDEREQREKEARIARLQAKVNELLGYPRLAHGKTSAEVAILIDRLGEIDTSHDYYDLTKEAMDAQQAALNELSTIYQQRLEQEAEAQRMAEQKARLAAEQKAMDEQREAMRQQQEEMERHLAEQRAEIARNQAAMAEQRAIADQQARDEAIAQQQQQAAEKAEQQRIEREAATLRDQENTRLSIQESTAEPKAPLFTPPSSRIPLVTPAPQTHFVGKECSTLASGSNDRIELCMLFGDEEISAMAFDEQGNEYALEVTVSRVRIINTQAA